MNAELWRRICFWNKDKDVKPQEGEEEGEEEGKCPIGPKTKKFIKKFYCENLG